MHCGFPVLLSSLTIVCDVFTRTLIWNHGFSFSSSPYKTPHGRAEDLYPPVASTSTTSALWQCYLTIRKRLGCAPLASLTPMNDAVSRAWFAAVLSSPCWVMVIQKSTLIARGMWNWLLGLKPLVCSESMCVLSRLLIVQPDHTYANVLSWSQSIGRITASIRHSEILYSGPYNHSDELRASAKNGSVSLFLSIIIFRCTAAQMRLNHFSTTLSAIPTPRTVIGYSFCGKYLIAWSWVGKTQRTTARSCF